METMSETREMTLPVTGMSCASCAVSVQSILNHTKGVADAAVNYANESVTFKYNPTETTLPQLDEVLKKIGYGLIVQEDEEEAALEKESIQAEHFKQLKFKTIWAGILSLPVVVIGMFFMDMPYGNYIMMALSLPVLVFFGKDFYVNAWNQARNRKANMDSLVALSTGIAFIFSTFNTFFPEFWHARGLHPHVYFEAASVIIFFILLGKLLEERAKSNTSDALKKLIGLQPKTLRVIRNGLESEINIKEVRTGDEIVIRSGEKIPVDGKVKSGSSFVDESLMTGEPLPALKEKGNQVFAGTINQQGSFTFEAEKVGKNTVLAQIIKTIQAAQGSRAPVQSLVDKIAGIFVPVVIGIAILTFIVWMIFGGENALTHALLASVSVLVIACPCALGLATPTAIMVGIGKGAQNNILIKDAQSLEKAKDVNAVILDKTGTITEGRPIVTDWIWDAENESNAIHFSAIKTLESRSEHPLAQAVVGHLDEYNLLTVSSFTSVSGKGVKGIIDGNRYIIGTMSFLRTESVAIDEDLEKSAHLLRSQAKTVVGVGVNEKHIAVIAIADKVKVSSREAIQLLQKDGIEVYMLTGDNLETATAVAKEMAITHFEAEVTPSDKMAFVKKLQAQGKTVAMVGDGINDSQALAEADVSIAMGKGSDIAMDVAKMTIISSDLLVLPKALSLSRKTVATIRQNLFWAFIYNLIGIPLAAGILYPINGFLLDPMIAGAAMALSSVSVVLNSLRLRSATI